MKKLLFVVAVGLTVLSLVGRGQNANQRRIRVFTNITEMVTLQPSNADRWVYAQTNEVAGERGLILTYCSTCAEATNTTEVFDLLAPWTGQYIKSLLSGGGAVDPLWTNILDVLQPTAGNSVQLTNLLSFTTTVIAGSFSLLSSATINLDPGTNCVDTANLGSFTIIGSDTNPDNSSLNLTAGGGFGQLIILNNGANSGFTLSNGIPMCDGSGAYIRLNGNWRPTTEGEGMLLFNAQDFWTEIGRWGSSTNTVNGDNVWENVSGRIRPVEGNVNNLVTITSGLADNATNVALVVDTTNYWSASGALLSAFKSAGTNAVTIDAKSTVIVSGSEWGDVIARSPSGDYFSQLYSDNTSANLFIQGGGSLNGLGQLIATDDNIKLELTGDFGGDVFTRLNPTVASTGSAVAYLFDTSNDLASGDSILLGRDNGNTRFRVDAESGYAGAGTKALFDDGTYKTTSPITINPTDGYVPYRSNATTFADSPWYRIAPDRLGFGSTTQFLMFTNSSLGLGPNAMNSSVTGAGNIGIGDSANDAATSGQNNIGIGSSANGSVATVNNNIAIGANANRDNTGGTQNIAIGVNALTLNAVNGNNIAIGASALNILTNGGSNIAIGSGAGIAAVGSDLSILIGQTVAGALSSGDNNIVIGGFADVAAGSDANSIVIGTSVTGFGSNTTTIGNDSQTAFYFGESASRKVHFGDEAYLAANETETTTTLNSLAMTANVLNGKKYSFRMILYCDNSTDAEGVRIDFDGGSATMTNFRAHTKITDSAALLTTLQTTALATDITAATIVGETEIEVNGSMEPSGNGTFIPRFAENTSATGTVTIFRGSHLILNEIP